MGGLSQTISFSEKVGHVLECQAASVRTGHIKQLPVEADLLENWVTKSDPERRAAAEAGNQQEGLRAVHYRVGGQERPHCELRIGDEGETRGRKCSRPEIRTAIRVLTEENELVADFHESEIRGVVTSVALAGLVRSQLSRHHIGPAVPAIYEGPDLITRSDAVEISVRRRNAEGTKALNRSSVVQPRQPNGFGGIPPRIDAIGVRGRGRDCLSGPVGSPVVVGLLPPAGGADDGHQQSDR